MKKKVILKIEFDNQELLDDFARWLCNSGEQQYWEYAKYGHSDMIITEFNYHGPEDETKAKDDEDRYGEFMYDNTIRTVAGRLDEEKLS